MKPDEELMLAYRAGDQGAFRELFARYAPLLARTMRRFVGDAAQASDLVQQTFLQLHRAREDFRPDMKLRPWLLTIAYNLARDAARRRKRRPETSEPVDTLPDPSPPQRAADAADTARRVRAALAELPDDQRRVIEMHWFDELPFEEIAVTVGATAGAVRVRAHRGYVALRKALAEERS